MSFQSRLFTNSIKIGLYNYSREIFGFIGSIFISRVLTPKEYGIIAIISVYYGFILRFKDTGFSYAIIRETFNNYELRIINFYNIIIGFFLALIMLFLAYPISYKFYKLPELFVPFCVFSIIILISTFSTVNGSFLRKNQKFELIGKTNLILGIGGTIFTYLLAILGFSYWSLILPRIVFPIILALVFYKHAKIGLSIPNKYYHTKLLKQIKPLVLSISGFSLLNYWARNIDNFWISKLYGQSLLAIYNRSYTFYSLPNNLLNKAFSTVSMPMFNTIKKNNSIFKMEYISFIKLITSILIIPLVLFELFPYKVAELLWGETWISVGDYLPLLGIILIPQIILSSSGQMFVLKNAEKKLFFSSAISASVTIISLTIGAFLSINHMLYIYSLAVIFITIPVNIYLGFYKSFNFSSQEIIHVWTWPIISSLLLFLGNLFHVNSLILFSTISICLIGINNLLIYFKVVKGHLL